MYPQSSHCDAVDENESEKVSNTHSVSDDFATLLKKRQGAEKARGSRSRGVA